MIAGSVRFDFEPEPIQARPGSSAGAARWLTGTCQPVSWLTAAIILAHAADRESAKARGDLAAPWESRGFPRHYLSVRPRAACDTQSVAGSHAIRKVTTHELGAESRRRSWRRRRDRFARDALSPDQIEGEMPRGEILPNTIPTVGDQCLPSPFLAGGVIAVNGDRNSPSPIAPKPQPETTRLPVDGQCQEAVGAPVADPKGKRAGQRLRSGGGLGRRSSRSSSAAPIIQCSSINRRTLCISVIGRESHRGG
jgi:hypothetical protein